MDITHIYIIIYKGLDSLLKTMVTSKTKAEYVQFLEKLCDIDI